MEIRLIVSTLSPVKLKIVIGCVFMKKKFHLSLFDGAGKTGGFDERLLNHALECLASAQAGKAACPDSLGWLSVSRWAGSGWLERYRELASRIRSRADAFVVVGVGGSNQAARAVVEALEPSEGSPEIIWAGNTLSAYEVRNILSRLKSKKSVYIDVIAKNFETLEPGVAFRTLRTFLRDAYGGSWHERVIVTGTPDMQLQDMSEKYGFTFLPFPEDVGGRYTALTPVGLLPMAVAGFDICALAQGAADMESWLRSDTSDGNIALRYAAIRNYLYSTGYRVEMLSFFEPRLFRFAKWWVQLFGESEGKNGLGLFPSFASYSEDLHSIGQFVQEGTRCLFETFIDVEKPDAVLSPCADGIDDGFGYLDGLDYFQINKASYQGTLEAHSRILPCFNITVESIDEYTFGQLFYFFMFSCYLSGLILGVNPFDQPGVEAYKARMFRKLGK